jgi:hypothetical protein
MNLSGTEEFIFDNDTFDYPDGIRYNGWAGKRFDILGNGIIDSVSIYNINEIDTTISFGIFSKTGALFNLDPIYPQQQIELFPGWNTVPVSGWNVENSFIVAHEVSDSFGAAYDSSSSYNNSFLRFGEGAWDLLANYGIDDDGDGVNDIKFTGEFGIRANISYEGADVTYNVYRDDDPVIPGTTKIADGLDQSTYTDTEIGNHVTYEYAVSATYPDGGESDMSDSFSVTLSSGTEHSHDDGSSESEFNTGLNNFSTVRFSASDSGEEIAGFKWYQHIPENAGGGAFRIKIWNNADGFPGTEIYSKLQHSGNQDGWNEKDLSSEGLNVTGDFWVGVEGVNARPFGLDTDSNSENSYKRIGTIGDWTPVDGNLMYRVYLNSGEGAGRVTSNWDDQEEVSGRNHPIYTLKWDNKKLSRVPLLINEKQVYKLQEHSPALNRSIIATEDAIRLWLCDFEDGRDTVWSYDIGWNLSSADYAPESPTHSFNSPNSNSLSVESVIIPSKYNIIEIYPNPFNPIANIQFEVAEFSQVKLSIIDLNGRLVSVLENGKMNPGQYQSLWDGNDSYGNQVSSGIYLAVLESNGMLIQTRKLVLLK